MVRYDDARIETGAWVVRHLPGDKDELVADDGRDKARSRRRGEARRVDLADLVPRFWHHRDQRGPHCRRNAEAALHDHRRALRDRVPPSVLPGATTGRDGP